MIIVAIIIAVMQDHDRVEGHQKLIMVEEIVAQMTMEKDFGTTCALTDM